LSESHPENASTLPHSDPALVGNDHTQEATGHRPTVGWWAWVRQAWRAATGRRLERLPANVHPLSLLAGLLVLHLTVLLVQRTSVSGPAVFSLSGWIYGWIAWPVTLLVVWLGMNWSPRHVRHDAPTAAWLLLFMLATLPVTLLSGSWNALWVHEHLPVALMTTEMGWISFGIAIGWIALYVWRITERQQGRRGLAVAILMGVMSWQAAAGLWLRHSAWEKDFSDAPARPSLTLSQEVFASQEALLAQTLEQIEGESTAAIQVYGLVYAPYAQDVFLRESALVSDVMRERMDADGRVVKLLNHPSATETTPWATARNLKLAIEEIAKKMRRDRDVLMVYFTSHGGADHRLASSHWPLEVNDLTAAEVRQWLDEAGIRYRALVVSACYSGGWVQPLSDEHTLVMTAADPTHTSYGCGNRSELTFFGRAIFDEELRQTYSLEEAFENAVPRIRQREIDAKKTDGFSNPQIQVGAGFKSHWARWAAARAQ
jgi:hypothetical protein